MTNLPDDLNSFISKWNEIQPDIPKKKFWQTEKKYEQIKANIQKHKELAVFVKKAGESFDIISKKEARKEPRKTIREHNFEKLGNDITEKFNKLSKNSNLTQEEATRLTKFTEEYNKMVDHIFERKLSRGLGIFKKIFMHQKFKKDVLTQNSKYKLNENWEATASAHKILQKEPKAIDAQSKEVTVTAPLTQKKLNIKNSVSSDTEGVNNAQTAIKQIATNEKEESPEITIRSLSDWKTVNERVKILENGIKKITSGTKEHIERSKPLTETKTLSAKERAEIAIVKFDHQKLKDQIEIVDRKSNILDERAKLNKNLHINTTDSYEMLVALQPFHKMATTICNLEVKLHEYCIHHPEDKVMSDLEEQAKKIRLEISQLTTQINNVIVAHTPKII